MVQPAGPPGGQSLAADQGGDQGHGEQGTLQRGQEGRQVEQQAEIDEEDRDEQAGAHEDHLLLHPALGQHAIDGQPGQKGPHDLLHPGQFGGQGGQEHGQQHEHEQLAVVIHLAAHQRPAQPLDQHQHEGGIGRHPQHQAQSPQGPHGATGQSHREGQHHQGSDIGEDRAADGHHHRLLPHRAIAAHDRITQRGVGGED